MPDGRVCDVTVGMPETTNTIKHEVLDAKILTAVTLWQNFRQDVRNPEKECEKRAVAQQKPNLDYVGFSTATSVNATDLSRISRNPKDL